MSSSDYDLLLVIAKYSIASNNNTPAVIGLIGYLNFGDGSYGEYRAYAANGVTVHFNDAIKGSATDNTKLIPYQIYGIKLHHTVEIKAIAPEVSTLASKCMLSDGETSVEDELDRKNKSAVNNLIDIKAYNSIDNPYTCPCDGYLRVCSPSASVVAQGYIISEGSSPTNYLLIQSQGLYESAFVRKGAKIFANGTVQYAHFLKLE